VELVKKFQDQGKWIFAICHGIQILLAAGVGSGLKLTCYANVRFELEQAGGEWVDKQCVRDGKIITAQTWESHPEFYREIFKAFAEESELESVSGSEPDKKTGKTKSPAKKARKKK
jgi:protease I